MTTSRWWMRNGKAWKGLTIRYVRCSGSSPVVDSASLLRSRTRSIVLVPDTAGIVFGFEGPVKPTIDALWPLLGGAAHAPADHRIQDLRVRVDDTALGVEVAVWPLES